MRITDIADPTTIEIPHACDWADYDLDTDDRAFGHLADMPHKRRSIALALASGRYERTVTALAHARWCREQGWSDDVIDLDIARIMTAQNHTITVRDLFFKRMTTRG
jgi:hypothetical protein